MKEKIFKIIKLLICFFSFYYIGEIIQIILKLFGISTKNIGNSNMVIYQFVCSLIVFILLCIVYKKEIKEQFIKWKKDIEKNIGYIFKMFITFMAVKYLVGVLSTLIITIFGFSLDSLNSVNQSSIETYVSIYPYLMLITTGFLGPIYEEVLFRLGIKTVIKNKYLFILTSGLIFGLIHIFPLAEGISILLGLIQSITYVTMGLFLAYIYEKSDNVFNSIGVHLLNNLLSVLVIINFM